jgi:PPOX class probable F420-dependent enzyme
MHLDTSTEFGQRALCRLQTEQVIWLTTISRDGLPQPRPIWFWWDGATLLFWSQPQAAKVKHIRRDPRVALNFESGHDGEDVVVFHGTADLETAHVLASVRQAFLDKYAAGIE